MKTGAALILLAATAVTSGCLIDEDREGLRDVFGDERVLSLDGKLWILGPAIEGRFPEVESSQNWSVVQTLELFAEPLVIPKTAPGPQGGGGESHELALPDERPHLEVRLKEAAKLSAYQAQWAILDSFEDDPAWTSAQAADQAAALELPGPGLFGIVARLLHDGQALAETNAPLYVAVHVHWTVESSVHPIKAPAGPVPSNYEEMSDRFTFDAEGAMATVHARTQYRGTGSTPTGTDVDLELLDPTGESYSCAQRTTLDPGPSESSEELTPVALTAGEWTVRVGAITQSNECAPQTKAYDNAAAVPYRLDVVVLFQTTFF